MPSYLAAASSLLAIVAVHLAYFLMVRRVDTQHYLDAHDTDGEPAGADLYKVEADHAVIKDGPHAWRSPIKGSVQADPVTAETLFSPKAMDLDAGVLSQPLICGEELICEGESVIAAPVKVAGDLIVSGRVTFDGPVTVNGYVKIIGEACFKRGLVCKSDVVVTGNLIVGARGLRGFVVARGCRITGGLALNGFISTTDGILDLAPWLPLEAKPEAAVPASTPTTRPALRRVA